VRLVTNQACLAEAALRRRRAGRFAVWGLAIGLWPAGLLGAQNQAARLELSCGAIARQSTPTALRQTYGADNLKDVPDPDGRPVALLFPDVPEQRIEIVWADAARTTLASFTTWERKSAWRTPQGVKMAQAIADVAELNGRSFILRGFAAPDAGRVVSWEGGKLEEMDAGSCRVAVWLAPKTDVNFTAAEWKLAEVVADAFEVASDDRRIKPYSASVSGVGLTWR